MPPKTKQKIKKEINEVNKYRWEFLRRNEEYRRDIDYYNSNDWAYVDECDTEKEYDELEKVECEKISERWGIDYPCYYELDKPKPFPTFSCPRSPVTFSWCYNHQIFTKEMKRNLFLYCSNHDVVYTDEEEIKIPRVIPLQVDLTYKKETIMGKLEDIIDVALSKRKSLLKDHGMAKKSYNKNLYDQYLKIWDFVQEERELAKNLTSSKSRKRRYQLTTIYKKYLTRKSNKSVEFATFRTNFLSCQKLIDGDYLKIK